MSHTEGNEFWKLRSKHGRDKIFSSPDEVLKAAYEYFEWCDDNPILRVDVVKGGEMAGNDASCEVPRPYTMEGFCRYVCINVNTFRNYESADTHKDFFEVFAYVRQTIRQQKLEHAMVGNYHANLVARELGIGEKTDITSGGKEIKNTIMFGGKEVEI